MSMGLTSTSASALNSHQHQQPQQQQSHSQRAMPSALEAPWDFQLPMPPRPAPTPPSVLPPSGTPSRRGSLAHSANSSPRNGHGNGNGNSNSNGPTTWSEQSPGQNRLSGSGNAFNVAAHGIMTGSLSAGPTMTSSAGSGTAPVPLSGAPPPQGPIRPSRAGTLPLNGLYGDVNGGGKTYSPHISSPIITSNINLSIGNPNQPAYNRAPTSMGMISPVAMLPSASSASGPAAMHHTPPPLHHQPFSAPVNPYAGGAADDVSSAPFGLQSGAVTPIEEHGEKDLPDKPKGRERSMTNKSQKGEKKGMFGFMSDLLNNNKSGPSTIATISTPYDPVHLTHVGFNQDTGEFTGLPKEWQQTLQANGVSKQEQEKNPEAVMEIMRFYGSNMANGLQEDVFDKMRNAAGSERSSDGSDTRAHISVEAAATQAGAEIARTPSSDGRQPKYAYPVSFSVAG